MSKQENHYVEIEVKDKQALLDEQGFGYFKLADKKYCLHCGEKITVGDYKAYDVTGISFLYICCPNAPQCNGTVIDWVD